MSTEDRTLTGWRVVFIDRDSDTGYGRFAWEPWFGDEIAVQDLCEHDPLFRVVASARAFQEMLQVAGGSPERPLMLVCANERGRLAAHVVDDGSDHGRPVAKVAPDGHVHLFSC